MKEQLNSVLRQDIQNPEVSARFNSKVFGVCQVKLITSLRDEHTGKVRKMKKNPKKLNIMSKLSIQAS